MKMIKKIAGDAAEEGEPARYSPLDKPEKKGRPTIPEAEKAQRRAAGAQLLTAIVQHERRQNPDASLTELRTTLAERYSFGVKEDEAGSDGETWRLIEKGHQTLGADAYIRISREASHNGVDLPSPPSYIQNVLALKLIQEHWIKGRVPHQVRRAVQQGGSSNPLDEYTREKASRAYNEGVAKTESQALELIEHLGALSRWGDPLDGFDANRATEALFKIINIALDCVAATEDDRLEVVDHMQLLKRRVRANLDTHEAIRERIRSASKEHSYNPRLRV